MNFFFFSQMVNIERPYLKNKKPQKSENWFFIRFRTLRIISDQKIKISLFEEVGGGSACIYLEQRQYMYIYETYMYVFIYRIYHWTLFNYYNEVATIYTGTLYDKMPTD